MIIRPIRQPLPLNHRIPCVSGHPPPRTPQRDCIIPNNKMFIRPRLSLSLTRCSQARTLSCTANLLRKQNSNLRQDLHPSPPSTTQIPIDICESKMEYPISPKVVVDDHDEQQGSKACDARALRPGMVLLKRYITLDEQVSIVRECRRFGVGPGGFYSLNKGRMLMCLGLDWDPATSTYHRIRRRDNARPPSIPHELLALFNKSINDSRACMEREYPEKDVEHLVPIVSPDVCLVHFYPPGGGIRLHQDNSESRESLTKGVPIVSMSFGDSGEFFYGDRRDMNGANKVVLESGDVLIFGGPSRHVFHRIETITQRSAPEYLIKETGLRPGRLNLTFRQAC